ncbi:MAG: uroporphyrinogen-III synthase [Acidobacteria bacterium Pan2503]|uniref:Uroporphyrinogen-III synthase n=1 Tax=Candidatus Acidiferrum panamense TaxID=2741543 RepID=A0A7V8SV82_9BACT|nr:uroporphyrinogen-III synthase [Candidatus Acidoferrum panamensis]
MPENFQSSLGGKRVVITRSAAQCEDLVRELSARGATPLVFPLVSFAEPEDFAPLDRAIRKVEEFDWLILTSAQAVRAVVERAADLERPLVRTDSRVRVACVGPVTADAARKADLAVEYIALTHNGVALANELGSKLRGAKVLLPRSDRANPDLPAVLERFDARVTEVIAYRTLRPAETDGDGLKKIVDGRADAVLFFSPSAVQHFAELVGAAALNEIESKLAITAVGPVTANVLRQAGVRSAVVAQNTTAVSVLEALEGHFAAAKTGVKRA